MPGELHAELTRSAERAGVSLNQFITTALARTIGWNGEGGGVPDAARERPAERQARWVVVALFANVAVIGLVAIAALVLLVLAWQT
jgi:hypothetical protein